MKTAILGLLALGWVAVSSAVQAQMTTLEYFGSPYTSVMNTGYPGRTFSVGELVNGYITLSAPLADNLHNASVTPTGGSFGDGLPFGITVGAAPFTPSFVFSTNSEGEITAWSFSIATGTQGPRSFNDIVTSSSHGGDTAYYSDNGNIDLCRVLPTACGGESTAASSHQGEWSESEVERAPEINPASALSSLTLLFGGLAVLCARRRLV